MALSKEQLNEIKEFINSRGFTAIEVEMEILDHVASAVEEKIALNPEMSIDKAIRSVHDSFGIMGFSTIEDALIESVGKKVRSLFKKALISHLTSFLVIKTIGLAVVIFVIILGLQTFPNSYYHTALFLSIGPIGAIPFFIYRKKYSKWEKKSVVIRNSLLPGYIFIYTNIFLLQLIEAIDSLEIKTISIILVSLLISLEILASSTLISSCYEWTYERWLKYN